MVKNSAFIFVKPHANTEIGRKVSKEFLEAKGLKVVKEGIITGEEVDEKKLIDNHYYSIASKATILKPDQLNVPADKFKEQFGLEWADALKQGVVFNAMDACAKLGVDADALDKIWAKCKADKKMIKFGGGFYCGKLEVEGKDTIYAFNGFFMSMRKKFVAPGTSLYYYVAEWDSDACNWEKFRGELLGPTDPVTAPETSLRGMFYKNWKEYGLEEIPNVGDNAVHASASPFEALCERMNWLQTKPEDDAYGEQLLKVIPVKVLDDWKNDPQVTYGTPEVKKSLFDSVEDMDSAECLAKLQQIATDMKVNC